MLVGSRKKNKTKKEPRTSEVPTLFELHIIQRLRHSILDLEFLNSP